MSTLKKGEEDSGQGCTLVIETERCLRKWYKEQQCYFGGGGRCTREVVTGIGWRCYWVAGNIFILDLSFVHQKSKYGGRKTGSVWTHWVCDHGGHHGGEVWSPWKYGPGELMERLKQAHWEALGWKWEFSHFPRYFSKKAHIRFPQGDLSYVEFC